MNIGVIGLGVVGGALYKALHECHERQYIHGYDIDPHKSCCTWDAILECDYVFVCVPTDKGYDGRLDMKNVESVLENLQVNKFKGVCIIKSTLRLGYIGTRHTPFEVIVFPEWLYADNPLGTTLNPEMSVIGCDVSQNSIAIDVINNICKWHVTDETWYVSKEEAVMIKLTANALAATKISFANQIQLICRAYGINEKTVMEVIKTDPRCASRYLTPGKPFGGYCLPKDTSELDASMNGSSLFATVLWINEVMKDGRADRED